VCSRDDLFATQSGAILVPHHASREFAGSINPFGREAF
jgi:hypothetical protein